MPNANLAVGIDLKYFVWPSEVFFTLFAIETSFSNSAC
jgi:hypothetical protein